MLKNNLRWNALRRRRIARAKEKDSNGAMLIVIVLILAGVGFYAFIGTAPKEAVQLMLFLFWGFLALVTVLGIVSTIIR